MIAAIASLLANDNTLKVTLTGGIFHTQEISRQATAGAFDSTTKELKPCVLVKAEAATPWGPMPNSGRFYVVCYFYDRNGYSAIETARKRVYALLHRAKLTPTNGGTCYEIRHANDVLEQEDPALGAAMAMSRYVATMER
jgi:hypothetical protein